MRIKLSIPLSSECIADALEIHTKENFTVKYVCTDSRELRTADLFIPLHGERLDGNDFIPKALRRGARVAAPGYDLDTADGNAFLLRLAEYYKALLPKLKYTVAITGSVGKTTTKEMLRVLIAGTFKVHATDGNLNNEVGVPMTVLGAPIETEILVIECGANHAGELSRISRCIKPDISVITNVGTAHIGNFGSREHTASAKLEIADGMHDGILLVKDDESLLKGAPMRRGVSVNGGGEYRAVVKEIREDGYDLCLDAPEEKIEDVFFPFTERHLLYPFAFAAAIATLIKAPLGAIRDNAAKMTCACVRHRYVDCGGFTLLDDSYNASLESVMAAIDMLEGRVPSAALLGDILELGEYSKKIHYEIGLYAATRGIGKLYLMGEHATDIAEGALAGGLAPSLIYISTPASYSQMAKIIVGAHAPGELILVKASHKAHLSRVISILKEEKGI